jgi:hypothetical protein
MRENGISLRFPRGAVIAGLLLVSGGCGTGMIPGRGVNATGSIAGRVLDAGGNPVANASVRLVNGGATQTDGSGSFALSARAGDRIVTVGAAGFAETLRPYPVSRGQETRGDVILIPQAASVSFQAESGGTVPLPFGGNVLIQGASLVRSDGQPATGTVRARAAFIDPRDPRQLLGSPGALAVGDGANRTPLVSGGMVRVEVTDAAGMRLDLASGATAEVRLAADLVTRTQPPFPGTDTATAVQPDTVLPTGLYMFNITTRQWEWVDTLQAPPGSNFLAAQAPAVNVWWNYDKEASRSCLDVRVQGPGGAPRANTHVIVFGVDYNGLTQGYTDASGRVSLLARRSSQVLINSGPQSIVRSTSGAAEPCLDAGTITY